MSPEYTASLDALREEIDRLDQTLGELLHARMAIIRQVAALKAAHTPGACHIRPGREGAMHRRLAERFSGADFPIPAALSVWRQIIGTSTHLESPIRFAASSRELLWQGRDYFSRMAVPCPVATHEAALRAVTDGTATIALLPPPSADTVALWADLGAQTALHVFAALPVILAPGEQPAAYAVASVVPEASGADSSLFALPAATALPANAVLLAENTTHRIVQVPGFVTALDGAEYLGTVPTPLTDSTLTRWPSL
jgi:chorismate mutase/prephenate dehydratase